MRRLILVLFLYNLLIVICLTVYAVLHFVRFQIQAVIQKGILVLMCLQMLSIWLNFKK